LLKSKPFKKFITCHEQYYKYREGITDLYLEKLELDDQNEVTLPGTITSDLIRDVFFTENSNAFGFTTPIDEGVVATLPLSSFLNTNGGIFDLGQYYMARQNLEDANRITGREKHWMYMNGKIKVFPVKLAADSKTIGVLYGKLLTPEELENDDWIRDFSVASAKTILGTIRRKFSGFSAAGGAATSDGSDLISEGKQEMADLVQAAKESRSGLGMFQI
jgi:hypothetical protein